MYRHRRHHHGARHNHIMLQVVKWLPMRREEATIMLGGEGHMQAEVMTAEGPSATALHDSAGLVVAPPGWV